MKSNQMIVILALVFSVGFAEMVEGVTFEFSVDFGTNTTTSLDSDRMTGNSITSRYSFGTSENLTTNLADSDILRVSSSFPSGQAMTVTPSIGGACLVYFSQEWLGTNGNLTTNSSNPTWDLTLTDMQGPMPEISVSTVHINRDGNQVFVEFMLIVTETVTFTGVQVDINGPFPDKGSKEYHLNGSNLYVDLRFQDNESPFSLIGSYP